MKILVTGGAGFIGHHFIRYVLERNEEAHVVCLDRIDSAGDVNRLTPNPRLAFVHHDLRAAVNDRVGEQLLTGRGKFSPRPFDYVVHMAAASHVDRSVRDPGGFILDNVIGTAHLLDWFRERPALRSGGKILYFSTDEVFGPASEGETFDPWSRFNPNNPYAASKAGGEALCTAYANTYGLPILVTHCTNVFGERQHREKFIPMTIDAVRHGQLVKIHADKTLTIPSSRFYTYVDNVSSAVMLLLREGTRLDGSDVSGKYNISGDREVSNLEVAQKIAQFMKRELRYEMVAFSPDRPRHDMRYAVDDSVLREHGWRPEVSFEEGLSLVVAAS